jgi:hypothetical protein
MSFDDDVRDKPERVLPCERCGRPGHDVIGEGVFCNEDLARIIREWRIRFERLEMGELTQ